MTSGDPRECDCVYDNGRCNGWCGNPPADAALAAADAARPVSAEMAGLVERLRKRRVPAPHPETGAYSTAAPDKDAADAADALVALTAERDALKAALREARAVVQAMTSACITVSEIASTTMTAGNGRRVEITMDDGERGWLVHDDGMCVLRQAEQTGVSAIGVLLALEIGMGQRKEMEDRT